MDGMYIQPMLYGTWQVRIDGLLVAEFSRLTEASAFLADPTFFRYGMVGGPKNPKRKAGDVAA